MSSLSAFLNNERSVTSERHKEFERAAFEVNGQAYGDRPMAGLPAGQQRQASLQPGM